MQRKLYHSIVVMEGSKFILGLHNIDLLLFFLCACAVIIPRLAEVAEANNSCQNLTKKQDIALSLVDAYRNISECCILL